MVDGSKYVIDQELDDLIVAVRDHRAAQFVARDRLVDGGAVPGRDPARSSFSERPARSSILPDRDED